MITKKLFELFHRYRYSIDSLDDLSCDYHRKSRTLEQFIYFVEFNRRNPGDEEVQEIINSFDSEEQVIELEELLLEYFKHIN